MSRLVGAISFWRGNGTLRVGSGRMVCSLNDDICMQIFRGFRVLFE